MFFYFFGGRFKTFRAKRKSEFFRNDLFSIRISDNIRRLFSRVNDGVFDFFCLEFSGDSAFNAAWSEVLIFKVNCIIAHDVFDSVFIFIDNVGSFFFFALFSLFLDLLFSILDYFRFFYLVSCISFHCINNVLRRNGSDRRQKLLCRLGNLILVKKIFRCLRRK